nr:probable 6-phosphogluconolactonase [Nicotiana tomentosiformis]
MSSSGSGITMSLFSQPQFLRTAGRTVSVMDQMYRDTASHRPCTDEGFSTLKSSATEHPPMINIFKGGSAAGLSLAMPGADLLRSTTSGAFNSASAVGLEEECLVIVSPGSRADISLRLLLSPSQQPQSYFITIFRLHLNSSYLASKLISSLLFTSSLFSFRILILFTKLFGSPLLSLNSMYAINDALSAEGAADDYETCLRHLVKSKIADISEATGFPKFDVILLGMGPDGHVASLFPGHPLVHEKEKWVTFIKEFPKPLPERITFTFPVINSSANIALVVAGAGKADVVYKSLGDSESSDSLPVQMVSPKGELVWFLDKAVFDQKYDSWFK